VQSETNSVFQCGQVLSDEISSMEMRVNIRCKGSGILSFQMKKKIPGMKVLCKRQASMKPAGYAVKDATTAYLWTPLICSLPASREINCCGSSTLFYSLSGASLAMQWIKDQRQGGGDKKNNEGEDGRARRGIRENENEGNLKQQRTKLPPMSMIEAQSSLLCIFRYLQWWIC